MKLIEIAKKLRYWKPGDQDICSHEQHDEAISEAELMERKAKLTDDMAMLLRRVLSTLEKDQKPLFEKIIEFLKRNELQGSPLREEYTESSVSSPTEKPK